MGGGDGVARPGRRRRHAPGWRTGGMSDRGSFSQITGILSGYFSRMRAASAARFSNGWSCSGMRRG